MTDEQDIHAYLFNLITVLCRDAPGDKLYFSQRHNIYLAVHVQVIELIHSAIEVESHGEHISLEERLDVG